MGSRSSAYLALTVAVFALLAVGVRGEGAALEADVRKGAAAVEGKVIAWRRDIHQHPELGDQEARTSRLVAEHLRGLGLEVRTGVARTGVVGVLKGGKPGRTVALRADMDALPVGTVRLPGRQDPAKAAANHNPNFFVDEQALVVGVRTMATLAVDFLGSPAANREPAKSPRPFAHDEEE
jgi:metal-dependent amidase/aminoacylase/carboxypeptidase family protein